jgi:hypothetical protein
VKRQKVEVASLEGNQPSWFHRINNKVQSYVNDLYFGFFNSSSASTASDCSDKLGKVSRAPKGEINFGKS